MLYNVIHYYTIYIYNYIYVLYIYTIIHVCIGVCIYICIQQLYRTCGQLKDTYTRITG